MSMKHAINAVKIPSGKNQNKNVNKTIPAINPFQIYQSNRRVSIVQNPSAIPNVIPEISYRSGRVHYRKFHSLDSVNKISIAPMCVSENVRALHFHRYNSNIQTSYLDRDVRAFCRNDGVDPL